MKILYCLECRQEIEVSDPDVTSVILGPSHAVSFHALCALLREKQW